MIKNQNFLRLLSSGMVSLLRSVQLSNPALGHSTRSKINFDVQLQYNVENYGSSIAETIIPQNSPYFNEIAGRENTFIEIFLETSIRLVETIKEDSYSHHPHRLLDDQEEEDNDHEDDSSVISDVQLKKLSTAYLQLGDAFFLTKHLVRSLYNYLMAGSCLTLCFRDPSRVSRFVFLDSTLSKMVDCLRSTRLASAAIVMTQMIGEEKESNFKTALDLISFDTNCLDEKYFEFVWEIGLLEIIAALYHKRREENRVNKIVSLIARPELNVNCPILIRSKFINQLRCNFFKTLFHEISSKHIDHCQDPSL